MATLSEIRSKVRDRADIVAETARYPDSELLVYINDSYRELYGLLLKHSLLREELSQSITADGSATYNVTAGHFATLAVFKEESQHYRRLSRGSFRDRPHGSTNAITGEAGTYRIAKVSGTKTIELFPRPQSGTYVHVYVPEVTALSADGDVVDDVLGWDEYIVIDAAIKVLRKENSETSMLENDKFNMMVRIETEAESQDMAESLQVANTRRGYHYGGDYGLQDAASFRWYRNGDDF